MRCTALLGIGAAAAMLAACQDPLPVTAGAAIAACPRDARPDDRGRCACDPGDIPVLGACVPPSVADAYCGPVGKATASGACVFPVCGADEVVDVDAGCIPLLALVDGGPRSCAQGASLAVEDRRRVCLPAGAVCPRGSQPEGGLCAHRPSCPSGSLPDPGACRPVTVRGVHGRTLVDLGAWAALALGVDGGPATPDLCRPLESRPLALGLPADDALALRLHITLSAPDGDVTHLSAEVSALAEVPGAAGATRPVASPVAALSEHAVATLMEPLRGLGGETTATRVDVDVRCSLKSDRASDGPN